MSSARHQLAQLIQRGQIEKHQIDAALKVTEVYPTRQSWFKFMDQLLLWLGSLAIAFSVLFFIAYNWQSFGYFAKFALVETLIVAMTMVYMVFTQHDLVAKVALLLCSIFLGVLLALYGQIYQTGADPWQLFFNWALLMLPWALLARFSAIWVVWLALLNISMGLYYTTFGSPFSLILQLETELAWALFIFNIVALIAWELFSIRLTWLDERWAARLIAVVAGSIITGLTVYSIFDYRVALQSTIIIWLVWAMSMYIVYKNWRRDLFMLAGTALSIIVVLMSLFAEAIFDDTNAGSFLFTAILLILLGTGSAVWLRRIHQGWLSE